MYAIIAFARPLKNLIYRVPSEFEERIEPGTRVIVPLGRRLEVGWVVESTGTTDLNPKIIKSINLVIDRNSLYSPELIELLKWASDYYIAPLGYIFKAAMPAGLSNRAEFTVRLTPDGIRKIEKIKTKTKPNINDRILLFLDTKERGNIAELNRLLSIKNSLQRCYRLEKQGLVETEQVMKVREDYLLRRPAVILNEEFLSDIKPALALCKNARAQKRVIEYLGGRTEPIIIADLMNNLSITKSPVDELIKKKIAKQEVVIQERLNLYPDYEGETIDRLELTDEQQTAYNAVLESIDRGEFKTFLLHGITGSGKTEVYISLCKEVIRRGGTALVLIPEISLTPQLYRRFQEYFGDKVALLHSGLPAGERFEQWLKAKEGKVDLVIGTRSAVFAPLSNLGIVIVDEEHDGSYKQEDTPRYNARDLAIKRGSGGNIPVLLGSATPSVETYHNALEGKFALLELLRRYGSQDLPKVTVVDMKEEFKSEGLQLDISTALNKAIEKRLSDGEQILILINRRGYRSRLLCRECGRIVLCNNCNVAMRFHKIEDKLVCHHCDFKKKPRDLCEYCHGEIIEFVGVGTQRIEEIFKNDYRTASIERLDRDTTSKKGTLYSILEGVRDGTVDCLIGTQMIAKGHDYANITLVGAVSVESILVLPDFRHSEKAFQLLTQVAGRAGRGEKPGEVIIQTFYPDHPSIKFAKNHDYKSFYAYEISIREKLRYPPFTGMAVIRFEGPDKGKLFEKARSFRSCLDAIEKSGIKVRGPKMAPLSKLRGKFRLQLLLFSASRVALNSGIRKAVSIAEKQGISRGDYIIDIDPYSLM